jgi:hypothetical protein
MGKLPTWKRSTESLKSTTSSLSKMLLRHMAHALGLEAWEGWVG